MRSRGNLVQERQQPRPFHVAGRQALDFEYCIFDQGFDRSIEMTPAGEPLPDQIEAMLPLWSQTSFAPFSFWEGR